MVDTQCAMYTKFRPCPWPYIQYKFNSTGEKKCWYHWKKESDAQAKAKLREEVKAKLDATTPAPIEPVIITQDISNSIAKLEDIDREMKKSIDDVTRSLS